MGTGGKVVNGMMATAYPNPFDQHTLIIYTISKPAEVGASIVDITGRELYSIPTESKDAGKHEIDWNAANLAAGIYYVRLTIDGQVETLRLIKAGK